MSSLRNTFAAGLAAAAFLAPLQCAQAEQAAPEVQNTDRIPAADNVQPAVPAAEVPDDELLAAQRGGDQRTTTSRINTDGIVSENAAYNLVTGNNAIRDGSFAGMSGMPLVIQNTGNNVLIQNSTILNLQMQ